MALINILKIGADGLQAEHDSAADSINMMDYQLTGVSLNGTTGDTVLGTDSTQFTNFTPATDDINAALLAIDTALGDIEAGEDTVFDELTNGEASAITLGDVVYISGNEEVMLADNDDNAKDDPIGVVFDASIAAATAGRIATHGRVEGALTGATAGEKIFLGNTPGELTSTVPTGSGKNVVLMGFAVSATDLHLRIQNIGKRA